MKRLRLGILQTNHDKSIDVGDAFPDDAHRFRDMFDAQDDAYKADVLPKDALIVSIEAGATLVWERYTGTDGLNIVIDRFGASAPAGDLFAHYGLTAEAIVPQIQSKLNA